MNESDEKNVVIREADIETNAVWLEPKIEINQSDDDFDGNAEPIITISYDQLILRLCANILIALFCRECDSEPKTREKKERSDSDSCDENVAASKRKRRKNVSDSSIPCDVTGCAETFPSIYFLKKHKDLGHQMVQCDVCSEFMAKFSLIKHMKTVHRPSIPCTEPNCDRTFVKMRLLETHIRREHLMIECQVCKKQIVAKRMKQHMEWVHLNMKTTMCDVCGQVFKSADACKRHYAATHTDTARVQCDLCKTFVKSKFVLYTHMRTVHATCDPITCRICGHQSPNKRAAQSHRLFHKKKEAMEHACTICGHRFASKFELVTHSNVHQTIREKVNCTECNREFMSRSGLTVSHTSFGSKKYS